MSKTPRYKLTLRRCHLSIIHDGDPPFTVDCEDTAYTVISAHFKKCRVNWSVENFGILCLNSRGAPMAIEIISTGILSACLVHPREVFRPAIAHSTAQLISFHNHPSGDPTPSGADISLGERLNACGTLLGIPVIDHLIVTDSECSSFMDRI